MKLKGFKLLCILSFVSFNLVSQNKITGIITDAITNFPIDKASVFDRDYGLLATSNSDGYFQFETKEKELHLIFYTLNYEVSELDLIITEDVSINQNLSVLSEQLNEVEIKARKAKVFELSRLKDVEGTSIYAGKKTEVVLVDQSMANLASNNARQIFSQVAGLNIFQNDDAGLQLNIGGRGLDPNRTSNFNTRQNGYDISADVLGYPESYYTPASEALKEIQVVRGAASLQYGTQFGGLVNFIMKSPNPNKPFEIIVRNTLGSNRLYTNFTSISGTKEKWSYYSFFNYKRGNGFRPNSEFESKNAYGHIGYQFNDLTSLKAEITYFSYLAQQAGGLNDQMFDENPFQSNRSRNWFSIDWLLYNLKFSHKFSSKTNLTINAFGLNATRNALGFRTNRVDQVDSLEERDLIKGDFNNFGFEARLLYEYQLFSKKATILIGSKFYKSNNTALQGPGSEGTDANFNFQIENYPNYQNQSNYTYPNQNISGFGENIFYINEKLSITPGFRIEYIKTESDGYYKQINTDAAGNVILNETIFDSEIRKRTFVLLGIGTSFKPLPNTEIYGNISQNYRSVTFADISIVNPAFTINPEIDDEKGFTTDIGFRGNYKRKISFDIGAFGLIYKDRIGFVQKAFSDGSVKSERGNVGDAFMYGIESLIDFNLNKIFIKDNNFSFNYFINISIIDSKYTSSQVNGIKGNKVEFVPNLNFKTGIKFGYKNLLSNIQYTYLSEQFTDATNAKKGNLSGVIGQIPAYNVLDISLSFTYKKIKLEAGVNNVANNYYYTRRATGYPGPGIIPSPDRNFYTSLEIKL